MAKQTRTALANTTQRLSTVKAVLSKHHAAAPPPRPRLHLPNTTRAPPSASLRLSLTHTRTHRHQAVASMLRKAVVLLCCAAGAMACPEDTDGSGAVDVNDLLGVLGQCAALPTLRRSMADRGACCCCCARRFGRTVVGDSVAEDTDGSGAVDVVDLLAVLSAFGRECDTTSICAGIDCNAHGTCDAGVCTCDAGWIGEFCDSPAANDCSMGADCGGQQWNDCGSSCPSICGEPPALWCNEMCERVAPAALTSRSLIRRFAQATRDSSARATSGGTAALPPAWPSATARLASHRLASAARLWTLAARSRCALALWTQCLTGRASSER